MGEKLLFTSTVLQYKLLLEVEGKTLLMSEQLQTGNHEEMRW
jgi:hypothetical protein